MGITEISIGNLILVVNSVTVSYLICYNNLLQNAADFISKCDIYFITKCDRSLLQNASVFYYKMRQFYYKMRQLLRIATTLLQNTKVIRKFTTGQGDDYTAGCVLDYPFFKRAL